ncbi:hypothetical protein [Anaerotignum faecicola]
MKKLTNQIISFILALSMVFTMNDVAFAVERSVDSEVETAYTLVQTTESAYGTVYYVKDQQGIQTRTIWDLVDILMAGASWAKLFGDPSWGNFGWAVLDTAALLPVLPSTAYFREGGKVFIKADEVAKFAKTSKGKKAIMAAMKTYRYSDGITSKAVKAINKTFKGSEAKKVLKLFEDAANKGLVGKTGTAGIKQITPTKKIGLKYTHEIKIKNSQYSDYRIFGYKTDSGEWVFDLFREGLH